MISVDLAYPDKALWPNGRPNHFAKARMVKKHRLWAYNATWAAMSVGKLDQPAMPLGVRIIVHGKAYGPLPDRDNASAAAKSYLDGIAQRLGINDKHFAAPTVEFAEPRNGRFIIEIGG